MNRKMKHAVAVGILLWIAIGWHGPTTTAQSDDSLPYNALDILFLVDQSGSMGGAAFDQPDRVATDPFGLRFEALQYALDTLGEYRQGVAPDINIRMAVVYFGDQPPPLEIMSWTPIAATSTPAEWELQRAELLNKLSADYFRTLRGDQPANLGNTDFRTAFESAQQTFNLLPPSTDEERPLRVVITLTDGEPCVDQGDYKFACGDASAQHAHMDALYEFTQGAFPIPDTLLYVIALDATGTLWNNFSGDWQQVTTDPARATRAESSQQVGVQFLSILRELIGILRGTDTSTAFVDLVPGENHISIPPYQRLMRVSLFKSVASPGLLDITLPDSSSLTPPDPRLTINNQDRPIEIWTITNPTPGEWIFTVGSAEDRIDVFLDLIPVEVKAQIGEGDFQQFDEIPLSLSLFDDQGAPLQAYPPPYDLQVESRVLLPDGTGQIVILTELIPGIYEGRIRATMGGVYQVGFTATSQFPPGTPYVVYSAANVGSFTVTGVHLETDPMPHGDYLVGNQVQIRARILDDTGAVIQLPTQQITAALSGTQARDIALTAEPDGSYVGTLLLDTPGTFKLTVTALSIDATGQSTVLGKAESDDFNVLPSQFISLVLISPEPNSEQHTTEGFPPLDKTNLVVVFETRLDENNQLIDVNALAADSTTPLLQVEVRDPDGKVIGENVPIEAGNESGQYQVVLEDLPPGEYTIRIQAAGTLTERYVLNPTNSSLTSTVKRVTNPAVYLFYGGSATLALLTIGSIGTTLVRRHRRRQHPARGKLVIIKSEDYGQSVTPIFTRDLGGFNSNKIIFKRRQLPIVLGITRMIVQSDSDEMSKTKRVRVTVRRGKTTILQGHVLRPGGSVALRLTDNKTALEEEVSYQLTKDPDDYGSDFGSLF